MVLEYGRADTFVFHEINFLVRQCSDLNLPLSCPYCGPGPCYVSKHISEGPNNGQVKIFFYCWVCQRIGCCLLKVDVKKIHFIAVHKNGEEESDEEDGGQLIPVSI